MNPHATITYLRKELHRLQEENTRLRYAIWGKGHDALSIEELEHALRAERCRYAPGACTCGCHVTTVAGEKSVRLADLPFMQYRP